jgi:DNA ligase-1
VFPPTEEVIRGIVRFCREALENDETPVLLGYSLGKSQEMLSSLAEAGLPLMLHGAVHRLTQIYEQLGHTFPSYVRYESGRAKGHVIVCPPNAAQSAMLRAVGRARVAVLTGWAVDPNCRFRYGADAAFPLSDHADFPDLVEFVRRVAPQKVYTLHGFAADFAATLRELGFDAQALSEDEQMTLPLVRSGGRRTETKGEKRDVQDPGSSTLPADGLASAGPSETSPKSSTRFLAFAQACAAIASTSGKLEKVSTLAAFLRALSPDDLGRVTHWFTGIPFGATENKILSAGWALLRDALMTATGLAEADLRQVYLKHSDLGETAGELWQQRQALGPALSLLDVDETFRRLHAARGSSAKRPILTAALQRCSALEAKFLVKIITGDLRIGLKEGLVEEAIAGAFGVEADAVREANLLVGNVSEVAVLAREGRLAQAAVHPFHPMKFMLASPEPTAEAIWRRWETESPGAAASETAAALRETGPPPAAPVVWVEDKYDGIRCQLHKVSGRVALYSRDLKDITATFPELADAARELPADVVLDGEVLAMDGDRARPFAELQRRLGRREGDLFMRGEIPIRFLAFDLLWRDGASCLKEPLRERRRALETLTPLPELVRIAKVTSASSAEEIESAFAAARARGNEGLMIKDPASVYSPGRRGLAWLKLKKALATLDCVVVGAEYGHGKRKGVLSDYTFAVRDETTGELKTIGKAYSGLTDAEIAELTRHFLARVVRQHGRYHEVIPDTVLEIAFDRIQPSARHNSGLALRFPRIARIRTDKSVAEIDTVAAARRLVDAAEKPLSPQPTEKRR